MKLPTLFFLIGMCLAAACPAQDSGLLTHSQNGVLYVSGGIAEDQRQDLQNMRSDFNLQLTFAAKGSGEYLVNVMVRIDSAAGVHFLGAAANGPLFLAKLAPGDYQVSATWGDKVQTKNITVDNSGIRELYFYW